MTTHNIAPIRICLRNAYSLQCIRNALILKRAFPAVQVGESALLTCTLHTTHVPGGWWPSS